MDQRALFLWVCTQRLLQFVKFSWCFCVTCIGLCVLCNESWNLFKMESAPLKQLHNLKLTFVNFLCAYEVKRLQASMQASTHGRASQKSIPKQANWKESRQSSELDSSHPIGKDECSKYHHQTEACYTILNAFQKSYKISHNCVYSFLRWLSQLHRLQDAAP